MSYLPACLYYACANVVNKANVCLRPCSNVAIATCMPHATATVTMSV